MNKEKFLILTFVSLTLIGFVFAPFNPQMYSATVFGQMRIVLAIFIAFIGIILEIFFIHKIKKVYE